MRAVDVRVTIGSITMYSRPFVRENFYLLTNPDELLSQLPVDHSTSKKQAGHGVVGGFATYGARSLPFSVEIHASSYQTLLSMEEALVSELVLPAVPSYDDDGSVLVLIHTEAGDDVQTYAIPLENVMPTISQDSQKRRGYTFSLFAENPILYSQTTSSESGPESFQKTTFLFNETIKFQDGSLPTFQDATGKQMSVVNDGNIGSPPVLTITGPTENPVITNVTTGKKIDLSKGDGLTLEEGESVEIDVSSGDVEKDDGTDVSGTVSDDSDLKGFTIEPGTNLLTLFDDTPSSLDGQLDVSFRSAWK